MSTFKNTIAHTAAAIAERDAAVEAAIEATRQAHPDISTASIEAKMTAFAEVVRNTRRKMAHPAGFDWALHHSFKVVAINGTHLKVEATKGRGSERVMLDIPREDLSLSTWQVTSIIRRLSAQRYLVVLNDIVGQRLDAVAKARKEVEDAQTRLAQTEQFLTEAKHARDQREARDQSIQARRDATRARRNASAPAALVAQ